MRIENDIKLDYNNVLLRPKRSTMGSRKEVDLTRTYKFRNSQKEWTGIPVMAANMQGVGTFKMAEELAKVPMFTCLDKNYQPAEIWDWIGHHVNKPDMCKHTAVSTGITDIDDERIEATLKLCRSIQYVCIDVANGYSERFLDYVARFRDKHPDITIIADGGCSSAGDVVKAFGGGADFVMLGGMMAGCDEGGGEVLSKSYFTNERNPSGGAQATKSEQKSYVKFYGSSTTEAQKESGGVQEHRTSEGRIVEIPYKGPVRNVVNDVLGGLRSGCTYVGARTLKQLSKCTTFVQVSNSTYNQSLERFTIGE
jgi:GMP reductase